MEWKPTGDYLTLKKFNMGLSGIVLPDDMKLGEGDIFEVISVGAGFYTETGNLIPYGIEPGDRVMIAGKLLKLPGEKDLFVGRQADVIAIATLTQGEQNDTVGS